jgi:hypothetical protein
MKITQIQFRATFEEGSRIVSEVFPLCKMRETSTGAGFANSHYVIVYLSPNLWVIDFLDGSVYVAGLLLTKMHGIYSRIEPTNIATK